MPEMTVQSWPAYTVSKTDDGRFETYFNSTEGPHLLGVRPKYKPAQRLCEQHAGRVLAWKSLGGGNYTGT